MDVVGRRRRAGHVHPEPARHGAHAARHAQRLPVHVPEDVGTFAGKVTVSAHLPIPIPGAREPCLRAGQQAPGRVHIHLANTPNNPSMRHQSNIWAGSVFGVPAQRYIYAVEYRGVCSSNFYALNFLFRGVRSGQKQRTTNHRGSL